MNWAEKYRPIRLDDVAGNPKALKELRDWAKSWTRGKPKKKAVVLIGDAGIGKTSAALALANEFGWDLVEMNASDKRNADAIRRIATMGALHETFTDEGEFIKRDEGGKKLIILDEADNLFGREDSGGVSAIVDTIRRTEQPIILIVNDYYGLTRRSSTIRSLVKEIKFTKISYLTVKNVLKEICKHEGLKASDSILEFLAKNSEGDIRSAINDLESIGEGKTELRDKDLTVIGHRDPRSTNFEVLSHIFKGIECSKPRESMRALDESPDRFILWVDENLPLEYKKLEDLSSGFDALSRADMFLGRVMRRQYYRFWVYASDLMTAGVAMAKQERYSGFTPYRFPMWLVKMSRTKAIRSANRGIASKLMRTYHMSQDVAVNEMLPYVKHLYMNDKEFRVNITDELDLTEREIAHLLDKKEDSPEVQRLVQQKTKEKEKTFGTFGDGR